MSESAEETFQALLAVARKAIANWMTPGERFRSAAGWVLKSDEGKRNEMLALRAALTATAESYDPVSDTRKNLLVEFQWLKARIAQRRLELSKVDARVEVVKPVTPLIGVWEIWVQVQLDLGIIKKHGGHGEG